VQEAETIYDHIDKRVVHLLMNAQNRIRGNWGKYIQLNDPCSRYGQKVEPVRYFPCIMCKHDFLSIPYRLCQRHVFASIPSSSILRAPLFTYNSFIYGNLKLRKIFSNFRHLGLEPFIFLVDNLLFLKVDRPESQAVFPNHEDMLCKKCKISDFKPCGSIWFLNLKLLSWR